MVNKILLFLVFFFSLIIMAFHLVWDLPPCLRPVCYPPGTSVLCLICKEERVVSWLGLLVAGPKRKLTHTMKRRCIPLQFLPYNSYFTAKIIWNFQFNKFRKSEAVWQQEPLCTTISMIPRGMLVRH